MTLIPLLVGILLAATLFASVLWSLAQAFQRRGRLRNYHLALALLTIGGMATVSWALDVEMRLVGIGLLVFGALAVWAERGTSRLLPLIQLLFGLALLLGLPITYLSG